MTGGGDKKKARKAGGRAVSQLQSGQAQYQADPIVQALRDLVGEVLSPGFTPDISGTLGANFASQAHSAAGNFLDQARSRLSGSGSGIRSGSARNAEYVAASGLGDALARGGRESVMQEHQARLQDAISGANIASSVLAPYYGWDQNIANAELGQAGILAQLAGIPSPGMQLGSSLGSLFGSTLGAAGHVGSFGNLFS